MSFAKETKKYGERSSNELKNMENERKASKYHHSNKHKGRM